MKKIRVKEIIEGFKKDYPQLFENGAEIKGVYGVPEEAGYDDDLKIGISIGHEEDEMVNPYKCHISLWVSFFTDHRKIPKYYKGIKIDTAVKSNTEPDEFNFDDGTRDFIPLEEINFPQRYLDYVLDNKELIRDKLGDDTLTVKDMLDALCWGDFEKYKRDYNKQCYEE